MFDGNFIIKKYTPIATIKFKTIPDEYNIKSLALLVHFNSSKRKIAPNGIKIILFNFCLNNFAVIKCPVSWIEKQMIPLINAALISIIKKNGRHIKILGLIFKISFLLFIKLYVILRI